MRESERDVFSFNWLKMQVEIESEIDWSNWLAIAIHSKSIRKKSKETRERERENRVHVSTTNQLKLNVVSKVIKK